MALRKIIEIQGDAFISTPDGSVKIGTQKMAFTAYCKIVSLNGDKQRGQVVIECKADNYTATKQASVPFSVADDAPNFIKQAYLHLKTLPEWADATDC